MSNRSRNKKSGLRDIHINPQIPNLSIVSDVQQRKSNQYEIDEAKRKRFQNQRVILGDPGTEVRAQPQMHFDYTGTKIPWVRYAMIGVLVVSVYMIWNTKSTTGKNIADLNLADFAKNLNLQ